MKVRIEFEIDVPENTGGTSQELDEFLRTFYCASDRTPITVPNKNRFRGRGYKPKPETFSWEFAE